MNQANSMIPIAITGAKHSTQELDNQTSPCLARIPYKSGNYVMIAKKKRSFKTAAFGGSTKPPNPLDATKAKPTNLAFVT